MSDGRRLGGLSCVINLSEGRDQGRLEALAAAAGSALLDVHQDPDHHRSVFTLAALEAGVVEEAALSLVTAAVEQLDLSAHEGVHPRLGVADVVPFVPFLPEAGPAELAQAPLEEAEQARDRFAKAAAAQLGLPCFLYGPLPGGERSLPEVRRRAFKDLAPDLGRARPHPSAGASCVGARRCLVAYNLLLEDPDRAVAASIARQLRSEAVRSLAFEVAGGIQVSCNLVAPWKVGPLEVYELVAGLAEVASCELVGLLPRGLLGAIPSERWARLGLSPETTLETRLGLP